MLRSNEFCGAGHMAAVVIALGLGWLAITAASEPPARPADAGPIIVGHRGLIRHAPENTLAGFGACSRLRLGFELDVRRTKDGRLVCMHDADVTRTTDGRGPIADIDFSDLRKLDAGSKFDRAFAGEPVPLFTEVLALSSRQTGVRLIALDLKIADDKLAGDLADLLQMHRQTRQVVCIGLAIDDPAMRKRLRAADPMLPVAVLAQTPDQLAAAIADRDSDWVYVRFVPTIEHVQSCHRAAKRVFVVGATVAGNELDNWRKARDAGVDALLTDYPLECRQALSKRETGK